MPPIMIAGIVLIVVILIVALCLLGYVKAPPDQAYIISGFRKHRTLIGKAGVRIPVLERLDKLSLALIPIDVKTSSAVPTADYINISVDAAVNVKISDDMDKLKLASANFPTSPPTTSPGWPGRCWRATCGRSWAKCAWRRWSATGRSLQTW